MNGALMRNELLIGGERQSKISKAKILIVGVGGVGGYALENLVRAGVGSITAVDGDKVEESNLNRQILALRENIGELKAVAAEKRAKAINPNIEFSALPIRYNEITSGDIFSKYYDYCIDCFDSAKDKIHFILTAKNKGFPIISAMGAGNRLNAEFTVTDIFKTKYDKLAKAVRVRLKEEGITSLKTVCSLVPPIKPFNEMEKENVKPEIASISYAPAIMGCMIAAEVIKDLIEK